MLTRRNALLFMAASSALPSGVRAQSPATRPMTIIVPYPAGGSIDLTGRLLADRLRTIQGQSMVIDNRSGANGLVGMEVGFRSEPNGLTLTITGASPVSAGAHLRPANFDVLGFREITRLVKSPLVLAVRKDLPVSTVAEFIALARKQELTYASAGIGSSHHLTGELFRQMTDTKLEHVPYRGSGPAINDLVAGTVDAAFGDPTLVRMGKAGQAKVLGCSSDGPWALNPDVPPMSQTVPGFVSENWYGIAAPPATPEPILATLHANIVAAMNDEATRAKFAEQGLEVATMPMADFERYVRQDSEVWKRVIQRANIQVTP